MIIVEDDAVNQLPAEVAILEDSACHVDLDDITPNGATSHA